MRIITATTVLTASLLALPAFAGMKPQCHSSGGDRVVGTVEPSMPRNPDRVVGSTDGNDNIKATFDQQALRTQNTATKEARRLARKQWIAARKAKLKERALKIVDSMEAYMQNNSKQLSEQAQAATQKAFEAVRQPASAMVPATVTPSLKYDSMSIGGADTVR